MSRIDNMPLTVAPIRVSRVVKHGNGRHFITLINSVSLRLPSNKPSNNRHIIASVNSVSLLVRRKILRLYF